MYAGAMTTEPSSIQRQTDTTSRERILKAALYLLAINGFLATTTRAIAAEAKVNQTTLFRHFRGKRELYVAAVDDVADEYHYSEKLCSAMSSCDPKDPSSIGALIHFTCQICREIPDFCRVLCNSIVEPGFADPTSASTDVRHKYLLPIREFIRTFCTYSATEGKLQGDPNSHAEALFAMIFWKLHTDTFRQQTKMGQEESLSAQSIMKLWLSGCV